MATNIIDGTYGLDCWLDPEDQGDPLSILYSENVEELRVEATRLIAGGRIRYCELSRYDYANEDWVVIEVFE